MQDQFIAALQRYGAKTAVTAVEGAQAAGYLDTGNWALNWAISGKFIGGGWPLGHVSEIYGDPSTGKSYLVARALASALRQQGVALLDDTERAFNPTWARDHLGVDIGRLAYLRSHTVQDHMQAVSAYLDAIRDQKITTPSILALDSLALLTTAHEMKSGLEKKDLTRAAELRTLFRVLGARLGDTTACYLITNHTIANIGGGVFSPSTTPGGGGPKYQASVRVELRTPAKLKHGSTIVGVRVRAAVTKNRLVPPFRVADIVVPFFEPIQPASGLVSLLLGLGVLEAPRLTLVLRGGEDTKIPAHKSDLLRQDLSGAELTTKYPGLLDQMEQHLAYTTNTPALHEATEASEGDDAG